MRPSLSTSMSLPAECLVLSVTSRSTTNLRSRRNSNENAPPPGIIRAFHPRPFRLYWRDEHTANLTCLLFLPSHYPHDIKQTIQNDKKKTLRTVFFLFSLCKTHTHTIQIHLMTLTNHPICTYSLQMVYEIRRSIDLHIYSNNLS